MIKTVKLLICLCCCATAMAQTGSIKGLVKDSYNGNPLAGVNVHMPEKGAGSISDQFGIFMVPQLAAGSYEMNISYTGYATEILKVTVLANKVSEVAVNLHPNYLKLEDVVVSGKTPAYGSIAAVDIQLRPVNNSQDILKMVPGLFIAQHAGGGKAEQIFLRGFDLDHGTDINISVDGMPVNMVSHAHGQGYADLHFLIPELVEKLSFEKGPYNAQYGNLATAANVAFSTPDYLKEQFVKAEYGQFNSKRLSSAIRLFDRNKQNNRQQWYTAAEYSLSDGYFDKSQHFNRYNFFTKYSATFNNKTFLSFSASTFGSSWDASGQIPQRAVDMGLISRFGSIDSTEAGNTSRTNANLFLQQHFNDHWSMKNRLYYSYYHFNLFSNFTFFLEHPTEGDEIQQRESRNLWGYTGSIHFNGLAGNKNFQSELGYGFRYDAVGDIELNHVEKQIFISQLQKGSIRELNLFAYWNNTLELTRHFRVNAGMRYDWLQFGYKNQLDAVPAFQRQNRGVVSPKINLTYTANKNLEFLLSSGIGFHSNDTRVILSREANKILPRVFGTDAGILFKPAKALLLKAAAWWMYSEQEFVYVGDAGVVEPSGESRRYGLDLMARYQPLNWLYADVDLNYTRARAVDAAKGADYVPLAAPFTSIGGLTARSKNGFSGSLRYRAMSRRPANEDNTIQADGYFLLDAMLSYSWKQVRITLSAQNLLNRDWREAQFDTESRLRFEPVPVSEIHYTPGTPLAFKAGACFYF